MGERIEVCVKVCAELPFELAREFLGMITDPVDKQHVQRPAGHARPPDEALSSRRWAEQRYPPNGAFWRTIGITRMRGESE
jgi:hypothetical protein